MEGALVDDARGCEFDPYNPQNLFDLFTAGPNQNMSWAEHMRGWPHTKDRERAKTGHEPRTENPRLNTCEAGRKPRTMNSKEP